ncbi:hypothetical protein GGX14DRAFT_557465 [Mycena pura]|uniref:Uncharacterized protein n=1 Tax=Mycena pura TaxID=153505 RepID=A0AAD6YNT8_9AGAR|nr:hypothetical protein GGX14DRAFT_557465 [Mycena pura]
MRRRPPDAHAQPPARRPARFRHALLLPDGHLPPSPGNDDAPIAVPRRRRTCARATSTGQGRGCGGKTSWGGTRAPSVRTKRCHFVRRRRRGHGLRCGGGLGRRRGAHEEKATIE